MMHYEDFFKLFMALLAGSVIGAEREYRSKSAGLRTIALICVGATLFTIMSNYIGKGTERIASNIVVGIGFLGAGIIFREESHVRGLTTSATVWVTAALGMCIGSGYYSIAMVGVVLVLFILFLLVYVQRLIDHKQQIRNYRIVFKQGQGSIKHYEKELRRFDLKIKQSKHNRIGNLVTATWTVTGSEKNHKEFSQEIFDNPEIHEFEF
ncbi:MgtC/SapB family protein [Cytophagaceae bacterium DM2B3-1]|uniref:MgtC/SapB family protein n=1 Tax=Xanthocytophaga flava TaxID=3048013 RepID=A0ABT7CRJ0_9BACT|nr:MgtC/SapB family protein [Xanthocytophaga flavus]MDJ1468587.1 MgtC/SapB family protein [Xanthocytophaga flavus]MDJ1496367.1 MgtC/SapB family protein [Xanthocytophaga flavus]